MPRRYTAVNIASSTTVNLAGFNVTFDYIVTCDEIISPDSRHLSADTHNPRIVTECTINTRLGKNLAFGKSVCMPGDVPNWVLARAIALGRASDALSATTHRKLLTALKEWEKQGQKVAHGTAGA